MRKGSKACACNVKMSGLTSYPPLSMMCRLHRPHSMILRCKVVLFGLWLPT